MLNDIRNIADSFVIRILLAFIAFAFVGWGIKDVLQTKNNRDLVTFLKAKNITENDFLRAKAEEINIIQRQSGANLSEEDIQQLDINNIVLRKLINNSILNHIRDSYDLDISDEVVIQFVKQSPVFKNEQGEFDIEIFKSFKNSYHQEEEYLNEIKEKILKNTLISIFLEAYKVPEIMVKNIIDYMAETRTLDLVQINLNNKPQDMLIKNPSSTELENFYQNNQEQFRLPELRSFAYVKISPEFMRKMINTNEDELINFYQENKDDFVGKTFSQVRKQVTEMLTQQKLDELTLEFLKNLEDNVASGSNLTEIDEKYDLKLEMVNDAMYDTIIADKIGLSEAADSIFDLVEGEVSYPIELQDKNGLLLIEVRSIKPSKIEDFALNQDKITKWWYEQQVSLLNLQIIENLAKEYAPGKIAKAELASMGVKINSNFSLTRAELKDNEKLPAELLIAIFQTKPGANTPIFKFGNSAYFAYVKSITSDKPKAKKIKKSAGENIATTIKNSIIDELISHFINKNEMKINNSSSVFSAQ